MGKVGQDMATHLRGTTQSRRRTILPFVAIGLGAVKDFILNVIKLLL